MARDLLHILSTIGFDAREAQLYLIGLQLGIAPASEYSKRTSLNRITTYNLLESLTQRGFFTMLRRSSGKNYAPILPEQLAVEARKNVESLERILPELRSLQAPKERRPHVRFFEGWEGVRRVYQDTLTAQTEILNFANSSVIRSVWPQYDEEYVAERVRRNIYLRGIAPDDDMGQRVHGEDEVNRREIRLVPASDFDFTNDINIYDHKVAICSFSSSKNFADDSFGVIIESKEVAKTQRQIFEMAWRYAARAGSEKKPSTLLKRLIAKK